MKRFLFVAAMLLQLNQGFSQWVKVSTIPAEDIVSFTVHDHTLYAASNTNFIYKSADGIGWNAVKVSNSPIDISAMTFFQNKIYVASFRFGVFTSADNGVSWQNNGQGPRGISSFAIKDNILYASTLGAGVARLNVSSNTWSSFNNALPDYSANANRILSTPGFLFVAAGANGTYYRYDFKQNRWEEEFYFGTLRPGLMVNTVINADDSLWAVSGNRIIRSNDGGASWNQDRIGTHNGASRFIFRGTALDYTITNQVPEGTWVQQRDKNAGIGESWANDEEFVPTGFAYDIIEFNDNLYMGKADGLYAKIRGQQVPVHFSQFQTSCVDDGVFLQWSTVQEQSSDRFEIERSVDGTHFTSVGRMNAAGNSTVQRQYSFVDHISPRNNYYRVVEYGTDGAVYLSSVLRPACSEADAARLWPNPSQDFAFLDIISGIESPAMIKVIDSKGALLQEREESLTVGNTRLRLNFDLLPKGVYHLLVNWNGFRTSIQFIRR